MGKHWLVEYREENPLVPQGARVRRFRKPINPVRNRVLYAVLLAKNIKFADLASQLGVNTRSVNNWVVGGVEPREERRKRICELLGYSDIVLFNPLVLKSNPDIEPPSTTRYTSITGKSGTVLNEVLHGLLILHNFSIAAVAVWCGMHPVTLRRIMRNRRYPNEEYIGRLAEFFRVPKIVLLSAGYTD